MMPSRPNLLSTTRLVLRALLSLNFILGMGIGALLLASFFAPQWLQATLGARPEAPPALMTGMRLIMLIGLAGVPLANLVLARLLAMVTTVRDGAPFIPANAARLQAIAWALLAIQILNLAVGAVCASVSMIYPLDIGWSPSVDGWLSVLLLFILARVFDAGTKMRIDLEGTV
ncbi:DUF2975 domain-containing protein [Chromobacterium sp. Panama]|uniref:DUF2975 domain-containing protein n=1 Tax=Chromobacterium sp. Panama TaxID=2161826 RepID=UPI000D301BCA|nr:DUF2975 domain-containing protein [Chromobacterium sp. Panama]PTU66471.1 DUF2975 domain-containing protein [Chromobacterium sp. Panama]